MKFTKLMLSAIALLGLTVSGAHARNHHRYHGPRVSFGFNIGSPYYGYCRPYYAPIELRRATPVYMAPMVYAPYVRPSFGISFGSGPVNFGFGF